MSDLPKIAWGLTPEQQEERRKWIGGSDATILMGGDPHKIHDLWLIKTGRKEGDDLSGVLPVMMGHCTEPLNRHWYCRETGRTIARMGEQLRHPDLTFMGCTLDGVTTLPGLFEAKHVNAFSAIEEVAQRYMAQVHHNMCCAGLSVAELSVFVGTLKYELVEIKLDEFYLAQLVQREREFWQSVTHDVPPPGMEPVAPPVPPEQWRTVDMTGNNQWASFAADWLESRDAAKKFDSAAKGLKEMMETDIGNAGGHGIQIKRAKNGNLSIKEAKK